MQKWKIDSFACFGHSSDEIYFTSNIKAMQVKFDELLDKVTHFIESEAKSDTVVGSPFQLGEFSCIPVIRVGMGFGTGGGEGGDTKDAHGEGGGAGAGMGIEPMGFLVSRGEQISFINVKSGKGLSAAFEKVPDLLEKYLDSRKEQPAVVS